MPGDRPDAAVRYAQDARPEPAAIADLREAVGYERAEGDYPRVYEGYGATAAAYDGKGRLVGWCASVDDGVRHAFLVDVIVHPDLQRRGIGSALLGRVVAAELAAGISIVHADFAASTAPFYERNGFRPSAAGILIRER